MIPYGRQDISLEDIHSVEKALRSDYLTTGPAVGEFEEALCRRVGAGFGVAVSSGTSALHCAVHALGIGPGDEVIVPPISFAATANCVLYVGATPIFADIESDTLCISPDSVAQQLTPKTKAVIGVDYAGQPCDWGRLRAAVPKGVALISDACHALGAEYNNKPVGAIADITVFSFHPVKHITTGEGGMVVTDNETIAEKIRRFRNHGINVGAQERNQRGTWLYDQVELGFNYRITDVQCALGLSQLERLDFFLNRRKEIAATYDQSFRDIDKIRPLSVREGVKHAYHLYVVKVPSELRSSIFESLRNVGIGVNVHYIPIYFHSYYRERFGNQEGMCKNAELSYSQILSLPIHPKLSQTDLESIIKECTKALLNSRNSTIS